MQRWWFLEDPGNQAKRDKYGVEETPSISSNESTGSFHERTWRFRCQVDDLEFGEIVCVTGDCDSLGNWEFDKCVVLIQECDSNIWSRSISIPLKKTVRYRYCVLAKDSIDPNRCYVRRWETIHFPRTIDCYAEQDLGNVELATFGSYNDQTREDKGWLTSEVAVQFKLFDNPIQLKSRLNGRLCYVKVTPVNLRFGTEGRTMMSALEESLTGDSHDVVDQPANVITKVATLNNAQFKFSNQEQFGRPYNKDECMIFHMVLPNLESTAFLVDLYTYSSRAKAGEPPHHLGYHYIMPGQLKNSIGTIEVPITCAIKNRPIGLMFMEYLVVKPMQNHKCNFKVSYAKHWTSAWTGLDVGHRGLGTSFRDKNGGSVRENTIASMKSAAAHGADMVEFDVQLSKDYVPIIYHDFQVCVSMKKKKYYDYSEMLELPVKELTLEQLQQLKVYHVVEGRENEQRFFDEELEEHQPFPQLSEVLNVIDTHIGFNVEIKWTMRLKDGSYELYNPFDMNMYVDKILEVVLQNAGDRRIVFSCFHPDICTMIRLKQNVYPVMFLTQGVTEKYPPYHDVRCINIEMAVQHAVCQDILGIVVNTEDLLRDATQISLATDAGLVIFCWGEENNNKETIQYLKKLGLHAVIYDMLDININKSVKESVFLLETKESKTSRELLTLSIEQNDSIIPNEKEPTLTKMLDLTEARTLLDNVSTATSLFSISSLNPQK